MTLCYSMILVKLFCRTQPGEHLIGGHHGVIDTSGGDDPLLLHDPGEHPIGGHHDAPDPSGGDDPLLLHDPG